MPAFIATGPIFVDTPQQNAGVFWGINSASNWDPNMKLNTAQGGNFGVMSTQITGGSMMFDNLEFIDGVMNANDIKISPTLEF